MAGWIGLVKILALRTIRVGAYCHASSPGKSGSQLAQASGSVQGKVLSCRPFLLLFFCHKKLQSRRRFLRLHLSVLHTTRLSSRPVRWHCFFHNGCVSEVQNCDRRLKTCYQSRRRSGRLPQAKDLRLPHIFFLPQKTPKPEKVLAAPSLCSSIKSPIFTPRSMAGNLSQHVFGVCPFLRCSIFAGALRW